MPTLPILLQTGTPGDCILTGLCNVVADPGPLIPPGVMYVALGLVLGGAIGWRRARRAAPPSNAPSSAP